MDASFKQRMEKRLAELETRTSVGEVRDETTLTLMNERARSLDHRLDALNELREMVIENEKTYARQGEVNITMTGFTTSLNALHDRINGLADLVHAQVNRSGGARELWGFLIGGLGLAAAIAAVAWGHK